MTTDDWRLSCDLAFECGTKHLHQHSWERRACLARALRKEGLTYQRIGDCLGVTRQRANQLVLHGR